MPNQDLADTATIEHALREDAGREDTLGLICKALKRAYGWRVETPSPQAEKVVAMLEMAKAIVSAVL